MLEIIWLFKRKTDFGNKYCLSLLSGKYMTNVTCQRKGPTELVLENNPELYKKITYDSTNPDKESQCFMNIQ